MLYLGGALTVLLTFAIIVRTFLVQAFKVPSGAMVPTIQIGDHILVDKLAYGRVEVPLTERPLRQIPGRQSPRRGDVIVFLAPAQASADHQRRDFA